MLASQTQHERQSYTVGPWLSACVLTLKTMDTRTILRERFGFDDFRPAQREVIDLVLGGQSVLSVMPTGSGKSLCFQLPALTLPGLTLVVSPLIALMKDQTDHLDKLGVPAGVINSTVPRHIQHERLEQAAQGEIKLLYVAPERFQNEEFQDCDPQAEGEPVCGRRGALRFSVGP